MYHHVSILQLQKYSVSCWSVTNVKCLPCFPYFAIMNMLQKMVLKVDSVFRSSPWHGYPVAEFLRAVLPASTLHITGSNNSRLVLFMLLLCSLKTSSTLWGCFVDEKWPKVGSKLGVKGFFTLRVSLWGPSMSVIEAVAIIAEKCEVHGSESPSKVQISSLCILIKEQFAHQCFFLTSPSPSWQHNKW